MQCVPLNIVLCVFEYCIACICKLHSMPLNIALYAFEYCILCLWICWICSVFLFFFLGAMFAFYASMVFLAPYVTIWHRVKHTVTAEKLLNWGLKVLRTSLPCPSNFLFRMYIVYTMFNWKLINLRMKLKDIEKLEEW